MFEKGKIYANRIGTYKVLEMNGPKMRVRYDDGNEADLNVKLQQRIWDNIVAEQEAKQVRRATRKRSALDARYLIHSIGATVDDLVDSSWSRVVGVSGKAADRIRTGDRVLFFAIESQAFFAAGTVTGAVKAPKDAKQGERSEAVRYYGVELDLHATELDETVTLEAAELEIEKPLHMLLNKPGSDCLILEDEFEDLVEMLTEHAELDEDEDEVELDEEDEYDD